MDCHSFKSLYGMKVSLEARAQTCTGMPLCRQNRLGMGQCVSNVLLYHEEFLKLFLRVTVNKICILYRPIKNMLAFPVKVQARVRVQ